MSKHRMKIGGKLTRGNLDKDKLKDLLKKRLGISEAGDKKVEKKEVKEEEEVVVEDEEVEEVPVCDNCGKEYASFSKYYEKHVESCE